MYKRNLIVVIILVLISAVLSASIGNSGIVLAETYGDKTEYSEKSGLAQNNIDNTTPNDALYSEQWALRKDGINAEAAWDITTGDKNIVVGVLDSGIFAHDDLKGNLIVGNNFLVGYDTNDTCGHGTKVAGIIGAVANNNIGISGIAQNISVRPLKISKTISAENIYIKSALDVAVKYWETDEKIHILNFSFTGYGDCTYILENIDKYK